MFASAPSLFLPLFPFIFARFFALVLLLFTRIQEEHLWLSLRRWSSVSFPFIVPRRFAYRYHAFSRYCLTRAIFMQLFPSLSRTHLIYRAVRYDQQQFSSVRCWCAHCHTRYIETRSGHWLSPVREVERWRGGNEGDRAGSHAWCVIRPRKEGRQAARRAGRRVKKKEKYTYDTGQIDLPVSWVRARQRASQ